MEYQITTQYNKPDEEMMIDWVPVNMKEEFDCKAKLEELKAIFDEKAQYLEESTGELDSSLKQFKEIIAL
jgi:hypothetical protein